MNNTDIITPKLIDWAEAHGACAPALKWLRAKPRTVADVIARAASVAAPVRTRSPHRRAGHTS